MKPLFVLSAVILLTSCVNPISYQQQSWATMGLEQASAVCRNEVQVNTTSQHLCMDAKGWTPVY